MEVVLEEEEEEAAEEEEGDVEVSTNACFSSVGLSPTTQTIGCIGLCKVYQDNDRTLIKCIEICISKTTELHVCVCVYKLNAVELTEASHLYRASYNANSF